MCELFDPLSNIISKCPSIAITNISAATSNGVYWKSSSLSQAKSIAIGFGGTIALLITVVCPPADFVQAICGVCRVLGVRRARFGAPTTGVWLWRSGEILWGDIASFVHEVWVDTRKVEESIAPLSSSCMHCHNTQFRTAIAKLDEQNMLSRYMYIVCLYGITRLHFISVWQPWLVRVSLRMRERLQRNQSGLLSADKILRRWKINGNQRALTGYPH